jgi:hypothetical protein
MTHNMISVYTYWLSLKFQPSGVDNPVSQDHLEANLNSIEHVMLTLICSQPDQTAKVNIFLGLQYTIWNSIRRYQLVSWGPIGTWNISVVAWEMADRQRPLWEFCWKGWCKDHALCSHTTLHYLQWYYHRCISHWAMILLCCCEMFST